MTNSPLRFLPAEVNSWLKVGCLLAAMGATTAFVASVRVPVAYQATARVQPSWRLAGSVITLDKVDRYAATLQVRLKSPANLNRVILELGLTYGPSELASKLSVAADTTHDEQIAVTATDSNPVRASQIANAVVASYIQAGHSPPDTIWFDSEAVPPQNPARPRPQLEGLVGGMAGALMAGALFYSRRQLDHLYARTPQGELSVRPLIPASPRGGRPFTLGLPLVSCAALLAGTAASGALSDPTVALVAFVPLLILGVVASPGWRLAVLVVGGLLVFQSAQTLTVPKVTYLFAASTIAVVTGINVWGLRRTPTLASLRPLIYASAGLALLLALSFVVAHTHGIGQIAWARDAAPYGLLSLALLLAVDISASRTSRIVLEVILVCCGLAAALAYSNDWLQHRGYGALPLDLPVLQSFMLPAALFSYASAQVVAGRHPAIWVLIGLAVGFLLFVTGSRATLCILVGPVVIAAFAGPVKLRLVLLRLVLAVAPTAGAAAVTAGVLYGTTIMPSVHSAAGPVVAVIKPTLAPAKPRAVSSPVGEPSAPASPVVKAPASTSPDNSHSLQTKLIAQRFERILLIAHDPSFVERITVDRLAWSIFIHHPAFGMGPGFLYEWPTPGGQIKSSPYFDSGLSLLAKFGLAAVPVVVLFVIGLARVIRDNRFALMQRAALVGYCSIAVAWMTVEAPLEDKGLGLGLVVLLVLVLTDVGRQPDRREVTAIIEDRDVAGSARSRVPIPA